MRKLGGPFMVGNAPVNAKSLLAKNVGHATYAVFQQISSLLTLACEWDS